MSTRANWFAATLPTLEGEDPFEMPIEEVGRRIDLSDPAGRLQVRLQELVTREGVLYNMGTTCALKDRGDTVCLACPLSQAGNEDSNLGLLCKVGREQEVVLTELAVIAVRDAAIS